MINEISLVSLFVGTALCGIGTMGILRLPDFMNRLHAGTVITTLGSFFILLPVALYSIETGDSNYLKSAIILLFSIWIGGAVGSHSISRAMFSKGMAPSNLVKNQMEEAQ